MQAKASTTRERARHVARKLAVQTAQGTVETAVEAMKEGAYDYLTKPIEPHRLKILLDKIVERQDTLREVKVLRKQLREHGTYGFSGRAAAGRDAARSAFAGWAT